MALVDGAKKGRTLQRPWSFDDRANTYDNLQWVRDSSLLTSMINLITEQRLAAASRVLDVATGTGAVAEALTRESNVVVGLDLSHPMLVRAQAHLQSKRIRYVRGMGEALPLSDQCMDLIVCRNGLHQMSDPRQAMMEISRVLRPSGVTCIIESVVPDPQIREEWRQIILLKDRGRHPDFVFTADEFENWVSVAGYEIVGTTGHDVPFDVNEWLTMGGLDEARVSGVMDLFENARSELIRAMAIERRKGSLWAMKRSHMVLARTLTTDEPL